METEIMWVVAGIRFTTHNDPAIEQDTICVNVHDVWSGWISGQTYVSDETRTLWVYVWVGPTRSSCSEEEQKRNKKRGKDAEPEE